MRNRGLSGSTVKIIGIISMLLDHCATVLIFHNSTTLENVPLLWCIIGITLRLLGRLSFTIFSYFIVEGIKNTHNIYLYAFRLFVLAILSEIPFDLAFYGKYLEYSHQNTIFTLLFGFLAIQLIKFFSKFENNKWLFLLISVFTISLLAELLHFDYGFFGILFIVCLYVFRTSKKMQYICSSLVLFFCGFGQIFGALAFIPISVYTGKRGKNIKYLFYIFYPLHLFLLYYLYYRV